MGGGLTPSASGSEQLGSCSVFNSVTTCICKRRSPVTEYMYKCCSHRAGRLANCQHHHEHHEQQPFFDSVCPKSRQHGGQMFEEVSHCAWLTGSPQCKLTLRVTHLPWSDLARGWAEGLLCLHSYTNHSNATLQLCDGFKSFHTQPCTIMQM